MKRRQFIHGAAATLLVPLIASVTGVRASTPGVRPAAVFFDERFPAARRLAATLSKRAPLVPVRGDVTRFWQRTLSGGESLCFRGVTTESFPFCLDVLARDVGNSSLDIERFDRDLHIWTLRAGRSRVHGAAS